MQNAPTTNARAATLAELEKTVLPNFLSPPPSRETFRDWLDEAGVPRFKANPTAKRGGGLVWYSVAHVEKMLRGRMLPGRISIEPRRVQSALP